MSRRRRRKSYQSRLLPNNAMEASRFFISTMPLAKSETPYGSSHGGSRTEECRCRGVRVTSDLSGRAGSQRMFKHASFLEGAQLFFRCAAGESLASRHPLSDERVDGAGSEGVFVVRWNHYGSRLGVDNDLHAH